MNKEDKHYRFLLAAVEEAKDGAAQGHGIPYGAVVVRNGEIVAKAHNEANLTGDPTAHAELLALRKAALALGARALPDCALYATGQPCLMCLGAVHNLKVPEVYYANSYEDANLLGLSGDRGVSSMSQILGSGRGNFSGAFESSDTVTVVHYPIPEALALYEQG